MPMNDTHYADHVRVHLEIESRINFMTCERANAQLSHLAKLLEKGRMDVGPRLTRLGISVRLSFAAIEFGGETGR